MSKITLADVTTAKILGHLIGDEGVSPIFNKMYFTQYIITISREDLKKYGINYWDKMPVPKAKSSLLAV